MIWITYYQDKSGGGNCLIFGGAFSTEEKAKAWINSQAYVKWMWKVNGMLVDHCWCKEVK